MEIRVEIVGDRIHLACPYRADIPAKCKKVKGARWEPKDKVWRYPLAFETCLELRKQFGKELVIGPELHEWAKREKQRYEHLFEISQMSEAQLDKVEQVAPALAKALGDRKYQQVGAHFMSEARAAILADQPGLGKTLQALAAIIEADIKGPILVLAPSIAAQITWPNELRRWLPQDEVYVAQGNRDQRQEAIDSFMFPARMAGTDRDDMADRVWLICNAEMVRTSNQGYTKVCQEPLGKRHHAWADLFLVDWAATILDESHKYAVAPSGNLKKQSLVRQGLGALPMAKRDGGPLKLMLSGTPTRGKIINMWGSLNWLRPDMYTSFWRWAEEWFDVFDDGYGRVIGDLQGGKEDAFYASLKGILLRRTKEEVAADLPPKMYAGEPLYGQDGPVAVWLPMDPKSKQAKAYKSMNDNAAAALESGSLMANGVLAEMTRLKQFASCYADVEEAVNADGELVTTFSPRLPSNKFEWIVNFLTERGIGVEDTKPTNKVVISSQFTSVLNLFRVELKSIGVKTAILTGETSQKDRVRYVKEFQESEIGDTDYPHVFLLNIMAGGVSITLDAADEVVFIDETHIPDDQEQVEDRCHRVSRTDHQVIIYYLKTLGTIEEEIAVEGLNREEKQKEMLDGSRGVEYAKKLLTQKMEEK